MSNEIQTKFNEYQRKYPLYNRDAIVDLMVEDGEISPDVAKRIKSNESLFLIDNNFLKNKSNNDFSITEALGGNFSTQKTPKKEYPKTQFNREIENTFQSDIQGDCWLLSDINAMNQTKWGKEAIKNSIIPDNKGGVTIHFKGSPLAQKNFHITAEDIQNAKNSGRYSTGNDDMLALELATEQVIKKLVKSGNYQRITDFDKIIGYESFLTGIYLDQKSNKTLHISTLITGVDRTHANFNACDENDKPLLEKEKTLLYLAKNQKMNAIVCTFSCIKDMFGMRDDNDLAHGFHAYAVKEITSGKEVVVIDPYHSDKEIKIPWKKFVEDVESLYISSTSEDTKKQVEKQVLPENYVTQYQQHLNRLAEARENALKELADLKNKHKQRDNEFKLKDCLNDTSWELLDKENSFAYNDILSTMKTIDKDIVLQVLDHKPNLIEKLDKYQSGLGSGNRKKALIAPIIDALVEKAKESKVQPDKIDDFKRNCYNELNAVFYTDEKVIISEVEKIRELINSQVKI